MFAIALAVLILRRPETLTRAEFWNEDGQVFYIGSFFGSPIDQLLRSYAGFLHTVPRLVAWLERLVDVSIAPLVGNAIALALVAALAVWISSERLASILPSPSSRLTLAALVVVLPGSWETLGSISLIQFYLAIFLILGALTDDPVRPIARVVELTGIGLAGLSGPFSLLFVPLAFINAVVRRSTWAVTVTAVISMCAMIQVLALLLGSRAPIVPTPDGAAALILARTWSTVIGDFWLAGAIQIGPPLPIVAIASAALFGILVAASERIPPMLRATILYVLAVSVAAALAGEPARFPDSTFLSSRYVLIPTFLVALLLAAGVGAVRSRAANAAWMIVGGLFMFAIVGDFSLPRHATHEWALRSACIGGPAPCDVPVEYPNAWTIHWPGRDGSYVQPGPRHPEADRP